MAKIKEESTAIVKATGPTKELVVQASNLVMDALKNVALLLEKENLKPAALAMVYRTVDKEWPVVIKDLRDAARAKLLEAVKSAKDAETAKEGQERWIRQKYGGKEYKIQRAQYKTNLPDAGLFEQLLREKDADLKKYMRQTISYEFSEERGRQAIEDGVITEAEWEDCRKTLAETLKVEPL